MAKLQDKIENALNEARILALGVQVLIAFELRTPVEAGFDKLSRPAQLLNLCGLLLLLVGFGLLLFPPAFHRIVERGNDTPRLLHAIEQAVEIALLPFAVALGMNIYIALAKEAGPTVGALVAGAITLAALGTWFGVRLLHRARATRKAQDMPSDEPHVPPKPTPLTERIKQVLTEARVVLPGAQALLGFQFATTLLEGYEKLPLSSRYVHLCSLCATAVCVILLVAPSAYHRIVEHGEDSERFNSFASRMVLAAMVPLALAMCGDLFVVARKTTHDDLLSIALAAALLLIFAALWLGVPLLARARRATPSTLAFIPGAR